MDIQSVWAAIVGALVFLATIGTIIVAIPVTNTGTRMFFGKVKAWWQKRRRLETAAMKELIERQERLEGYFVELRNRSRETFHDVEADYRNLRDITNDHELRLNQMKPLEDFVAATRPLLDDLQETVLKLQAAQIRGETEQQQALDNLRTNVARLRERVENLSSGFLPRPKS